MEEERKERRRRVVVVISSSGGEERTRDGWRTHVDYRMGQGESVWRTTAGQPGHIGVFLFCFLFIRGLDNWSSS